MEKDNRRKILAMDIGGGTQDIILYEEGKSPENFVKMVLPSPTSIVAKRIKQATREKKHVHLTGTIMGGGRCTRAIREHLQQGLPVTAEPEAARTIKDDLAEIEKMGVVLRETAPVGEDVTAIQMKDVDLEALQQALEPFLVELPREVAVAVQDHGEAPPGTSNRIFRFEYWQNFLQEGGSLFDLAYYSPPDRMTRMKAVQKTVPGALVMDTCAAAIRGSLLDESIRREHQKGVVLVNIGNQHTFAALTKEHRIFGLFEHHTRLLSPEKLFHLIGKLRRLELTHEEIFEDGGHGCSILPETPLSFNFVGITGPRRCLAQDLGYHPVNPHGDMMMTGCFGLLEAVKEA